MMSEVRAGEIWRLKNNKIHADELSLVSLVTDVDGGLRKAGMSSSSQRSVCFFESGDHRGSEFVNQLETDRLSLLARRTEDSSRTPLYWR